jgi:hypothetical protein
LNLMPNFINALRRVLRYIGFRRASGKSRQPALPH